MAFRRSYGKNRFYNPTRKIMRSGGQLTNKFRSKVRSVCKVGVPTQKRVVNYDPPIYATDRKWNRVVRVFTADAQTSILNQDILQAEAAPYGISAVGGRWNNCKVLSLKAWGASGASMTINVQGLQQTIALTGGTTFNDLGDGCRRACISVDMPLNQQVLNAANNSAIISFASALRPAFVDFYCELS